jgi:hypothetical protein
VYWQNHFLQELDSGRMDLGRTYFGRMDLGRMYLGIMYLGRITVFLQLDSGRMDLGRMYFGRNCTGSGLVVPYSSHKQEIAGLIPGWAH